MVMHLNPTILFGFPPSIFSVTTKQEKVAGTALGLDSSGFLCLLSGCHMFLARSWSAGVVARGVTAAVVPLAPGPGQAKTGRTCWVVQPALLAFVFLRSPLWLFSIISHSGHGSWSFCLQAGWIGVLFPSEVYCVKYQTSWEVNVQI